VTTNESKLIETLVTLAASLGTYLWMEASPSQRALMRARILYYSARIIRRAGKSIDLAGMQVNEYAHDLAAWLDTLRGIAA
jgi:hypothetical protein